MRETHYIFPPHYYPHIQEVQILNHNDTIQTLHFLYAYLFYFLENIFPLLYEVILESLVMHLLSPLHLRLASFQYIQSLYIHLVNLNLYIPYHLYQQ